MNMTDGTAVFKVHRNPQTFTGMIMAFSGTINSDGFPVVNGVVRDDWHVCDGKSGTPNLVDRFILGG